MWRSVTVLCGLTLLAAFPANGSAQAGREALDPEPSKTEAAPERSVLTLDQSGLEITPSAPTLDEMGRGVRRARAGLIGSAIVLAAGGGIFAGTMVATRNYECVDPWSFCFNGSRIYGVTIGSLVMLGGLVGMVVSGKNLSVRKYELRNLQEAKNSSSHRIQFDPRTSRFVF